MFLLSLLACPAAQDPRCEDTDRTHGGPPAEAVFVDLECVVDASGYYDTPCTTKSATISFTDGSAITLESDALYVVSVPTADALMVTLVDPAQQGLLADGLEPMVNVWISNAALDEAGRAALSPIAWDFPAEIPCTDCATVQVDAAETTLEPRYTLGVSVSGEATLQTDFAPPDSSSSSSGDVLSGSYTLHIQATMDLPEDSDDAVVCDGQIAYRSEG